MDKEAKLLECLEIISKNPRRNAHGLLSVLQQLIELNPKLGLRCWEDCIKAHLPAIKKEFSRKRFNTDSLGHILITKMEVPFPKSISILRKSGSRSCWQKNGYLCPMAITLPRRNIPCFLLPLTWTSQKPFAAWVVKSALTHCQLMSIPI